MRVRRSRLVHCFVPCMPMFPGGSPFQQQAAGSHRFSLPLSLSLEYKINAFDTSVIKESSDPRGVSRSPATSWKRPSVRARSTTKASLTVVALILALALTSLCMRLRTKSLGAGLSQRRLAGSEAGEDSDDEELGGILEDCLNMEQEYQITSGSGMPTDASPSVLPTFQPAVFLPRETVSVTGPMHGAAQTATSHHLGPRAEGESLAPLLATFDSLTSASREGVSFTPSFYSFSPEARLASISPTLAGEVGSQGKATVVAETAGVVTSMHETQQNAGSHPLGPAAGDEGFSPLPISSYLSPSASSGSGSFTPSFVSLSPEAWLEGIPAILAGDLGPQVEQAPPDDEQPSTSAAAGAELVATSAPSTDQQPAPPLHPFIRLPAAPRGLSLRRVNPKVAIHFPYKYSSSSQLLGLMRTLLSKPELTLEDAHLLLHTAESMVDFARNHLRPNAPVGIADALRQVGFFFMLADAVVSAIEVLNQHPASFHWWKPFVSSFPQKYSVKRPRRAWREMTYSNLRLLRRLAAALEIYKTGIRPHRREIVRLKRRLLCSPNSVAYFKSARWDPWRKDDEDFATSQVESSDDSGEEDKAL
ncbi:hypothetical protein Esti_003256 [Eimeria stiedai]